MLVEIEIQARTHRPPGSSFLPRLFTHGKITCSSVFPEGHVVVMSKEPGETLETQWPYLSDPCRDYVRLQVYRAVDTLRKLGVIALDCGAHNVLFDERTGAVTMLDFEVIEGCEGDTWGLELPEMRAIFKDDVLPVHPIMIY